MKSYTCDHCGTQKSTFLTDKPSVLLCGVGGISGGILLPEHALEKHFCSTACFWQWTDKYRPQPLTRLP